MEQQQTAAPAGDSLLDRVQNMAAHIQLIEAGIASPDDLEDVLQLLNDLDAFLAQVAETLRLARLHAQQGVTDPRFAADQCREAHELLLATAKALDGG